MNRNETIRRLVIMIAAVTATGCATHSGVLVGPTAHQANYTSAYVVVHGDNSADMDALIQKELLRHGLKVEVGAENSVPGSAQLLITYTDDWKWDLVMYLRRLDVMAFDARTHVLLATGSWKNSVFHAYYSPEKVVGKVVGDTLTGIGVR